MNEDFLYYIWKYRLFDSAQLSTVCGMPLQIIRTGEHNKDSGPDFQNARIKIGDTIWAGNIEIHINASEWEKHNHQKNKAYNNIILHVVYNNDFTATRNNKEPIPVLELKDIIPQHVFTKYKKISESRQWIPCEGLINKADSLVIVSWMERLLVERLERKTDSIIQTLQFYRNNWEYAFYILIARNFGFNLNSETFGMLAKQTPLANLCKHKNNLFQIESMLFGQSGLLRKNMHEEYPRALYEEYSVLKQKFDLTPVDGHLWKFLRLHPSGFPTIRIAQFASLIYKSVHMFSKILEARKLNEVEELFDAECSDYWQTHYVFGKGSPKRSKKLGKAATDNIIINTVVPFLFVYGAVKKEEKYKARAIRFLEQIEGEKNSIISKWKLFDMPVRNAANTQALLELKNSYCSLKQCLNCGIGTYIMSKK